MKKLRILILTPSNEVKRLLLEVELGLCIVDRGRARCRPNKIEAGLGVVDRGWPRGRGNKVEGRLGKVDRGGSGGRANKVKSGLGLSLATAMPGNKGCFPALRGTDEVLLPVVLTVEVCLPGARGVDKAGLPIRCLPLAASGSCSHDGLLGSNPVQLRLGPVTLNSWYLGAS